MINVEMTDDIRKFETKTTGPFTTRQLICIGIACLYSFPIALSIPTSLSNKLLIGFIIAMPVVLCGYIKMDGAYFEVLALRILYLKFLAPKKRKYIAPNSFREEMKMFEKRKESQLMAKMTSSQRKKYIKSKEQKSITYSKKREYKVYR